MQLAKLVAGGLWMAAACGWAQYAAASEQAEQLARNALALDANAGRGAALFRAECAGCHGRAAHGNSTRLIPALAGQRRAYLVKQLADFATSERMTTAMHAVVVRTKVRDPRAWADVALYLNALPVLAAPKAGPGTDLAAGQAAYEQWCASCHEGDARGDDEGFVPALRNQHYAYLVEAMLSIRSGHRLGLDAQTAQVLAELTPRELAAIADHVARLRGPVRDRARLRDDGSVSN
jgi:cytochrome c553